LRTLSHTASISPSPRKSSCRLFYILSDIRNISIALVAVAIKTDWFFRAFGATFSNGATSAAANHNDRKLHTIVYLQVAIISQALIFITRSHGFFFMERPSVALFGAFCLAQLISSIIAAYGNWGFTEIEAVEGAWIGIVWVWVNIFVSCLHFIPLTDLFYRTSSGSCLWI
jgi:magnesium-transporting ATPase (P-type)